MSFSWVLANLMAAYLDLSVGVFVVFAASFLANHPVQHYHYFVGSIIAVLPDVDVLREYLRSRGKLRRDTHKMLLHRPLIILPLTFMFVSSVVNLFWGVTVTSCLLCHYLHDLNVLNWLWPFRADKQGADDVDVGFSHAHDAFLNSWLKPTTRSVSEILRGTLFLGIVIGGLVGLDYAAVFAVLLFEVVLSVWFVHLRKSTSTDR